MSDQFVVVSEMERAAERGESMVLVSIVRTAGSTYRGVGARMLVTASGSTHGLLSGGCLEADLVEHASAAHRSGAPAIVTYDTGSAEEFVWGLGLGCNGLVEALVEPLTPARARELVEVLRGALTADENHILATVVRSRGAGAPSVTARMMIDARGNFITAGDWGDGSVLARVARDAVRNRPDERRGAMLTYADGDDIEVALEMITPRVSVVICGSGPDTVPVARLARELGWDVTVVDHRATHATGSERFAGARVIERADPAAIGDAVPLTPAALAVVMSHNYDRDLDYLDSLVAARVRYVGLLGPRSRATRLIADLERRGRSLDEEMLSRIHGPIGLDIGGDSPEAIAVSIIAEISAVVSGRSAGHLRDRNAPIHGGSINVAAAPTLAHSLTT